jgi:dienelactone hydrolase
MRVSARSAFVLIAVVIATSCSSSAKTTVPGKPTTTVRTTAPAKAALYASPGPFKVGYTTLRMADREVAVWYPANPSAVAGKPRAKYDQRTTLPADLRHFVPDAYNTVVTMPAYDNVAGNTSGPFPVVLFSHGTPAHRLASAILDAGIASWGFVVVSVDYLERGQITQFPGQRPVSIDAPRDRRLMLASLDLVAAENNRAGSVLHGVVDATRVASLGHSAGGTVAFDALSDSRLTAAIGWAPANPSGPVSRKPTMILGASGDVALTPATLTAAYAAAPAPKRFVEIGPAGHNSFTDLCLITHAGGGPVKLAIDNHVLSPAAATLFLNGCGKGDLTPERFFPVVQHFTVAELRDVFGIDASPVGLGDGVTHAFPGVTVTYRHVP